ncbi:MAG: tryptophan--tRNA ligase [Armatimonadetes bacterium]|nr:tryptophan--tRNA ligase [Armatimonadota bacterium]
MEAISTSRRKRILSGMRPTGKLHVGHLMGAIENWKRLQDEFECFYMVADWHALTTAYREPQEIRARVHEMVLDYMAGGVDPERCVFYVQSDVPEIAQLHLLLSMIVPVSWLERSPSYKDQITQLGSDIATYGFLGYPVLMTCDIIIFKAQVVPVGQDQVPHLELCREIVRRFNGFYGPVFPEPHPRLTRFAAVPGLDGRKMSKSYGNDILLADEPDTIRQKMRNVLTDPGKVYKGDPGRPEICTVYYFHKIYNQAEEKEIFEGCHSGALGCVDCKKRCSEAIVRGLEPLQERRRALAANPGAIDEMLREGGMRAREVARETLAEAREVMGLGAPRI